MVRTDTGLLLGVTPLEFKSPRRNQPTTLKLELAGHEPERHDLHPELERDPEVVLESELAQQAQAGVRAAGKSAPADPDERLQGSVEAAHPVPQPRRDLGGVERSHGRLGKVADSRDGAAR